MAMRHRKKPFSSKAKRLQLQEKRERQRQASQTQDEDEWRAITSKRRGKPSSSSPSPPCSPKAKAESGGRKLTTIFEREPDDVIKRRKEDATRPLHYRVGDSPYIDGMCLPENDLDVPKRPPWTKSMTPEELERSEKKMFDDWLASIKSSYPLEKLNYFELNLEVWRQLWRVLERSDVILYLVDARFPLVHFSTKLYEHIRQEHGKDVVLCLNKSDLVAEEAITEWIHYFETRFPGIVVTYFRSNKGGNPAATHSAADCRRLMESVAKSSILRSGEKVPAESFVRDYLDGAAGHGSEQEPAEEDGHRSGTLHEEEKRVDDQAVVTSPRTRHDREIRGLSPVHRRRARDSYLLLGVIGDPNMGKSTLLNNIFQRKVVSHSSTPGHTKHFQTMFLTRKICFCDSPGVVVPKLYIPRELQVLVGIYPIAQTREPYSAVRYLAERCVPSLPEIYNLRPDYDHEDDEDEAGNEINRQARQRSSAPPEWSPYRIAEAYALQRGYRSKGGNPDTYRACNRILRDAMNGWRVVLSFMPPPWYDAGNAIPPVRSGLWLREADLAQEDDDDVEQVGVDDSGFESDIEETSESSCRMDDSSTTGTSGVATYALLDADDDNESDDEDMEL